MPTAAVDKLKGLLDGVTEPDRQLVTLSMTDWKQVLDATAGGAAARRKLADETHLSQWERNPLDPKKTPPADLEVSVPAALAGRLLAAVQPDPKPEAAPDRPPEPAADQPPAPRGK